MPRPGPRPYECVRRAWHSDRHQPMRGSIIQQIFRVVTESHSSATRKNREWQEKLPRVVLKAEEIMYSKANSEAEYMDADTLWERLNDAIDTIIRRDESTETGQFLQPCIEAALVLGCVPVRASRSQRHSNPRSYLNPTFQEPSQATPASTDRTNNHRTPPQPPTSSGNQLTVSRCIMANHASSTSPFNSQTAPSSSYISTHAGPNAQPNFSRPMPSTAIESNTSLNFGSAHPLYYGGRYHNIEPQYGFQSPRNSNPNNIIIGMPVGWPAGQPSRVASTMNLLPDESVVNAAETVRQERPVCTHENAAEKFCDLSLRLGPLDPCTSVGRGLGHVSEDGGSSSHHQPARKHFEQCGRNFEFSFFPRSNGGDASEQEGRLQDKNANWRKRKAPDPHELEDGRCQWVTELQPRQIDSRSGWQGL